MSDNINVAFIGNPNCGKTTLFNAYTGANLKVANWPGVTVEKKEGHYKEYNLVDLPGIYSLTSYTMEEKVSRQYILDGNANVVIDVADASVLERNLYLALQLIELNKNVIVALNMIDIVRKRGMNIDVDKLSDILGVPVVPISARKRTGLSELMESVKKVYSSEGVSSEDKNIITYSFDIENKISAISERLKSKYPDMSNYRWHSIKFLEMDKEITEKYIINLDDIVDKSYEQEIIKQKYDFIENTIKRVLKNKSDKSSMTDKIDFVLTDNIFGIPIFLFVMAIVFFLTFTIGDFLKEYIEIGIELLSSFVLKSLQGLGAGEVVCSLIVDGIIAGVGGVISFLPNIFILFLALAFLEDSGYMSRVAYIMDGIMGKIGLSGRAFIPMLLGFGCTVPAVMASRTLENRGDRIRTILVTPFMSCSARLPIYIIISQIFFGKYAVFVAYSMYLIGIVIAIFIALIMSKFNKQKDLNPLLIELPEYKIPDLHTVFIYVYEKVKDYITKAGTTIFIASVILWFLLNFGFDGYANGNIENSFGMTIGKFFVPIMAPLGLGYWQIIVSLISGIAAKEVVVSSLSILFGISNISSSEGMSMLSQSLTQLSPNGFSSINAFSFLLFCLLYIPCIASITMIKKESNSLKVFFCSIFLHLATAWTESFLFFQIASNI